MQALLVWQRNPEAESDQFILTTLYKQQLKNGQFDEPS